MLSNVETSPLPPILVFSTSANNPDAMQTESSTGIPPPGDPPNPKVSWKDMVTGGVKQQKTMIDDAFLEGRILVSFPDGVEGDPAINIDPILMKALESVWDNSLVVKLLSSPVPLHVMERKHGDLWKSFGRFQVINLP